MTSQPGEVLDVPGSDRRSTSFLLQRRSRLWQTSAAGDGVEEILTSPKGKRQPLTWPSRAKRRETSSANLSTTITHSSARSMQSGFL